ncbi:MAG: hypothetical protein RsTaC01_0802 [Candidatus Paraimprobicoccus trichonymphae]|uniref:Uncharacterized protein n=1 Tax=Candidatus Paraimprobicoccus trichonymphae TaxID=3033793 RepID=A0AA48HWY2_9FIRM|nr:MAG: hypothetical protein RsTaC01_0802 [Candidatus Paraimprobicoccus trichonymphae]
MCKKKLLKEKSYENLDEKELFLYEYDSKSNKKGDLLEDDSTIEIKEEKKEVELYAVVRQKKIIIVNLPVGEVDKFKETKMLVKTDINFKSFLIKCEKKMNYPAACCGVVHL